jgi:hypothetical protein
MVQDVIDGHGADQTAILVADRHANEVVGGEPGRQLALWHVGPDENARLGALADERRRRLPQQPLEPRAAQIPAGRRGHRRLAHVDLGGRGDRHVRIPNAGQHLGDRRGRGHDEGLRGHQATCRHRVVTQQPPQVCGLDGLHRGQQPFALLSWHLGEQVRGVVGLHLLHHVGAALKPQAGQQPDLVLFGHLLQQVGQFLIIQDGRDLVAPTGRHPADGGGKVGRAHLAQAGQLLGHRARPEQVRVLIPRHYRRATVPQPPALRNCDRADFPAAPLLLAGGDGHIGHRPGSGIPAIQLGRQDLPGLPRETIQVDGAATQVRAVERDFLDPAEVDKDGAPLQRHDQPQRARRSAAGGRQDHHVADPADGQVIAVQQRTAPQPGREYLASGHGPYLLRAADPACIITGTGRRARRARPRRLRRARRPRCCRRRTQAINRQVPELRPGIHWSSAGAARGVLAGLLGGRRDLRTALRAAPRRHRDAHRAFGTIPLGRRPVALQQRNQAADRDHQDVVDHQAGDQERQDAGHERAIGKGGTADPEGQVREVGIAAGQRQQRIDKRLNELLDQFAELRADHHRDGQLYQVPAHHEVLETAHGQ